MADPASILSLIAASLSITIKAATIGKDIHSLTSKFRGTTAKVQQLSVHLAAVRVAARSLSSWLEDETVGSEEVEDVKEQLSEVLSACYSLLSDLHDHVVKALAGADKVGFRGAVNYIWDDEIINETTDTLHHQETAIILMLQALESLNQRQQRVRLREHEVVQTLAKAKKPSSSIFGLAGDERSRLTCVSETSERLDMMFAFDTELAGSAVYRNAFTALLRTRMIRRARPETGQDEDKSSSFTISGADEIDTRSIVDRGKQGLRGLENLNLVQQKDLPAMKSDSEVQDKRPKWSPQATSNGKTSVTRAAGSKFESDRNRISRTRERANKPKHSLGDSDESAGSWIPQATPNGRLFYFHTLTGATSMDRPQFE